MTEQQTAAVEARWTVDTERVMQAAYDEHTTSLSSYSGDRAGWHCMAEDCDAGRPEGDAFAGAGSAGSRASAEAIAHENRAALAALADAGVLRPAGEVDELADLRRLFQMQWDRSREADELWRAEDPAGRALTWPDLGDLLTWLMHRAAGRVAADVAAFHMMIGSPPWEGPVVDMPAATVDTRNRLVREECDELVTATERGDRVGIADALADLVYVAYGTAYTYRIPLDRVLAEVHRSNMTKGPGPTGKAVKGPQYSPPDVAAILAAHDGGVA